MASEYGSAPIEQPADQMRMRRVAAFALSQAGTSVRARWSKWCFSRKNEVRLVVMALTSCISSSPSSCLSSAQ